MKQFREEQLNLLWDKLQQKIDRMIVQLEGKVPHATIDGVYDSTRMDWWTSGFWPGILWIFYEQTGQERYKELAWDWDGRLENALLEDNNFHHDVGFQFLPTAVIKYKLTGDAAARRRGLLAATLLAGRYNPAGPYIRAWNPPRNKAAWNINNEGWSIIDSTMNLSLLLWASEELADPRFTHIAKAQADTVIHHFIRPDGSVRHICEFDAQTGDFVRSIGGQGYGPDSAWSRGAAWALHGMANVYRYTREQRYLDAAKQVAHFFVSSLEQDHIPLWDFRVPEPLTAPRDTSAAACAASGLLELASYLPAAEAHLYRRHALNMLQSLTDHYAEWKESNYEGILKQATGHLPDGKNINVSLIYGDYFYVEAIAKLRGWENRVF